MFSCVCLLIGMAAKYVEEVPNKPGVLPRPGAWKQRFDALPAPEELTRRLCEQQLGMARRQLSLTQELVGLLDSPDRTTEFEKEMLRYYRAEAAELARQIIELESGRLPTPRLTPPVQVHP